MLDVSIRTELLRLMLDLAPSASLTYLFITHDLSVAWVIADRIAVMYLGKIMEIGPAEEVIGRPAPPVHAGARLGHADAGAAGARPAGPPDDPGRRDAGRGAHPDRLPVPPALPAGRAGRDLARCRTEEPPLIDLGGGRSSACWLAESGKPLPAVERRVGAPVAGRRRAAAA